MASTYRPPTKRKKDEGGVNLPSTLTIPGRFIKGAVTSVDDIAKGLARMGGAVLSDVIAEPVRGLTPGGDPGWWRQSEDFNPATGQGSGGGSAIFQDILKPIGKSFANTADTLVDLSYVGNALFKGKEQANKEALERLKQFHDDPFFFTLEHVGNAALVGAVASKPAALGLAASHGGATGAAAAKGLRPLAGRGTRAQARGIVSEAADEAAAAGRRFSAPQVVRFTEDVVGHPYRTSFRKLKHSRAGQLLRDPNAFDPVTHVEKTPGGNVADETAGVWEPSSGPEGFRYEVDTDQLIPQVRAYDPDGNLVGSAQLLPEELEARNVRIQHMEVDESLRGQGIGRRMGEEAFRYAEEQGYNFQAGDVVNERLRETLEGAGATRAGAGDTYDLGEAFGQLKAKERLIQEPRNMAQGMDPVKDLNTVERFAQKVGQTIEDVRKSETYQRRFGEEARAMRRLGRDIREGESAGTGHLAEQVSQSLGRPVGRRQLRRKLEPDFTERTFLRDVKNMGKRLKEGKAGQHAALISRIQERLDIEGLNLRNIARRADEVTTGQRAIGQTVTPEQLFNNIQSVLEEIKREGVPAGDIGRVLDDILPDVDPLSVHLLGLNAIERMRGLPDDSLTSALIDSLEMGKFGELSRRAQRAGADAPERFARSPEELAVDLDTLTPAQRQLFDDTLTEYRRQLQAREPRMVEEGLIPEAGTRIGRAVDEPTQFSTSLDDVNLTRTQRGKLRKLTREKGKAESQVEKLRARRDALTPRYKHVTKREPVEALSVRVKSGEYTKETNAQLREALGAREWTPTSQVAKGGTREVVKRGPNGEPVVVTQRKNQMGFMEEVSSRPLDYVFRAVSQEDWLRMREQGYLDTRGSKNIVETEGMVADADLPIGYLPRVGEGRYVKIRVESGDGWRNLPDGDEYIKTNQQVPLDRVEAVSPIIEGYTVKSKNGNTLYRRRVKPRETQEVRRAELHEGYKKNLDRIGKELGKAKEQLLIASSRLENAEQAAVTSLEAAPSTARNLLTYAREVAPRQAAQLRAMADGGQVGDPTVLRNLADELDEMPKTLQELNSADTYIAYIRNLKDRGDAPAVSTPAGLSTRKPGASKRRGTATDINYDRDFRARTYWQEAEFQSYLLRRQADEYIKKQGYAKTGKSRLQEIKDANGNRIYSDKDIANMSRNQVQQALEAQGLKVYQPEQLFGTARRPSGNVDPLTADWITPWADEALRGSMQNPGWFEKVLAEGVWDPITNAWKVWALPLRLAWQVNNFAGGALLTMLAGEVSPLDYPSLIRASWHAVHDWNRGMKHQVRVPMNGAYRNDLVKTLQRVGKDSDHGSMIQLWLDEDAIILPNDVLNDIAQSGITRGDFAFLNNSQFLRDIGGGSQNILDQFNLRGSKTQAGPIERGFSGRQRMANLRQTGREVVDMAYHLNELVDNLHRTAVYIDQMGKGVSHQQAMTQVTKALGDYNKLSPFEKRFVKRIYPFYPWMRHVTEVVARSLHPSNINRTVIFAHMMHTMAQPNEWEQMLPEWAGGHIYTGMTEDGTPKFMSTRGLNPFLDVFDPAAQPNLQGLLRPIHPGIQMGYEKISGISTLTGRPFSSPVDPASGQPARPGLGEQLIRRIPQAGAVRDVYRERMGQPLTRYGTGEPAFFPGAEEGKSGLQSVTQLFGANVQPIDVENMKYQEKLREYKELTQRKRQAAQEERHGGRSLSDLPLIPG